MTPTYSQFGLFLESDEDAVLSEFAGEVRRRFKGAPADASRRLLDQLTAGEPRSRWIGSLATVVAAVLETGDVTVLREYGLKYPASASLHRLQGELTPEDVPIGPVLREALPTEPSYVLLGRNVALPFGTPATPLTASASWVSYLAHNGFNIITGRTVRSREEKGYDAPPHYLFVKFPELLMDTLKAVEVSLSLDDVTFPTELSSSVNSYGLPSPDPEVWTRELARTLDVLLPGQLFICSVVGSGSSAKEVAEDFAAAARHAVRAGAHAIELNLSYLRCPADVPDASPQQLYCESGTLTRRIVEAVAADLPDPTVAIVAKLAYLEESQLQALATEICPIVDGISGINAVPASVVRVDDFNATFPGSHRQAALAGYAIGHLAAEFVRVLSDVRTSTLEYFDIIASGGVMTVQDALRLRALGADAVQSGTGAYINPFLAFEIFRESGEWGPFPGDRDLYCAALRKEGVLTGRPFVPREILRTALT